MSFIQRKLTQNDQRTANLIYTYTAYTMALNYTDINHPLRIPLAAEVHSRPSLRLNAPEVLTHIAVFAHNQGRIDGDNLHVQLQILSEFCGYFGVACPGGDAKYFFHDFGRFRLKWECHTEFATYTFLDNPEDPTLAAVAIADIAQVFARCRYVMCRNNGWPVCKEK
jgi:uncharacterized membrane-anchored protein